VLGPICTFAIAHPPFELQPDYSPSWLEEQARLSTEHADPVPQDAEAEINHINAPLINPEKLKPHPLKDIAEHYGEYDDGDGLEDGGWGLEPAHLRLILASTTQ
jgi:hypothetical protein